MIDDRALERAARSFIEVGPTAAPPHVVEDALVLIERLPQDRDWFPWRFPKMTLPARVAAVVVVGALLIASALALTGVGRPGLGPSPQPSMASSAAPTVSSTTVSVAPTAAAKAARPSAPVARVSAVTVTTQFFDHLNAGRVEAAADLVWLGATIGDDQVMSREAVLAALSTSCGFASGPLLLGGGNTLSWEGWLQDRPGYACPRAGVGVRSRIVVENGLVVEYEPSAMSSPSP
jgi:hypothetical protein